jgi:hypothetical protein
VLAILEDAPEPMSPAELAAATGRKGGAVRKLLHLMMKVRKTKRGKYLHPSRTDLVTEADPLTPGNNGNKVISVDAYTGVRDGEEPECTEVTSLPMLPRRQCAHVPQNVLRTRS